MQRATCCVLLIGLFLGANAVWYGAVGDSTHRCVLRGRPARLGLLPSRLPASPQASPYVLSRSRGPVSSLAPLSLDTVAVGLVSSLVVYPVYLAILFLFRMSRSKVGAWGP